MDDLVGEFLIETNEGLEELDQDMVTLEQNPNDKDLLGKIFRLMHTIKGTCGFLGLPRLEKVAHHAENVLGRFRDGDLEVIPEYVTLIFDSLDRIKVIVGGIADTGSEPKGDDTMLIAQLDAVYEGKDAAGGNVPVEAVTDIVEEAPVVAAAPVERTGGLDESTVGIVSEAELEAAFAAAEVLPIEAMKEAAQSNDTPPAAPEEDEAAVDAAPDPASAEKPDTPDAPAKAAGPVATTQTLRVSVDVLEDLMTMVSELVLTRNQLLQILRVQGESEFGVPLMRLNQIVSELQEGVMKTRMQPIGNAWAKLPRIIRDLSIELDKKIDLVMEGKETELDRQVLELIKDPLTHMVRNSADHGIEIPAERTAAGKADTGRILLKAFHEGGHIIIQIIDDGKGLSTDKIKSKIISNGLATEDELEAMSLQQIQQFIFKAGFSTAEAVTAVSGRGVGMDVVRTNIEKIGGSVALTSKEGSGSTFTIKIPLTLAIVSALIIESGGERFAIPQISVKELVMTSANSKSNQIEMLNGAPVFRLRDNLLPLVPLDKLLKLAKDSDDLPSDIAELIENSADTDDTADYPLPKASPAKTDGGQKYIVVTQIGTYQFGIIVDKVFDTEEIVVKPVSKILRHLEIFSGNTILGDGSVVMILDPAGIARMTGEIETADANDRGAHEQGDRAADKKLSLLLFEIGDDTPKAVPLSLVARLEQVHGADIEHSSDQMMVQYRGHLMPLIPLNPTMTISKDEAHPVLVFSDRDESLGLVVKNIIDIIESEIDIQHSATKPGVIGSAIIDGKATEVVDVNYYLDKASSNWFADHDPDVPFEGEDGGAGASGSQRRRILLVDDSPFFRNMLTPLLHIAGYDVTPLESASDALDMCEDGKSFDIIISDIEMPDMNGFEFAEKVKANSNWQDTPMVALTSHATEEDIERGKAVGFNEYVAKFDRDKLLNTLSQTLKMGDV